MLLLGVAVFGRAIEEKIADTRVVTVNSFFRLINVLFVVYNRLVHVWVFPYYNNNNDPVGWCGAASLSIPVQCGKSGLRGLQEPNGISRCGWRRYRNVPSTPTWWLVNFSPLHFAAVISLLFNYHSSERSYVTTRSLSHSTFRNIAHITFSSLPMELVCLWGIFASFSFYYYFFLLVYPWWVVHQGGADSTSIIITRRRREILLCLFELFFTKSGTVSVCANLANR